MDWSCSGRPDPNGGAIRLCCFRSSDASRTMNTGIGENLSDETTWLCAGFSLRLGGKSAASCRLALVDNDATRAIIPSRSGSRSVTPSKNRSEIGFDIINSGKNLPASVGRIPVQLAAAPGSKEAYSLTFRMRARADPPGKAALARPGRRRFTARRLRSPNTCSSMTRSSWIGLRAPPCAMPPIAGHRSMSWEGFRELGVWSKPTGAPFVCIEPWHGYVSPAGSTANSPTSPADASRPASGRSAIACGSGESDFSSCPGLSRPSTPSLMGEEGVDARQRPG